MYISSYLTSNNVENIIIDIKGNEAADLLTAKIIDKVLKCKPDFVGISCLTTDVKSVFNIANMIKNRLSDTNIVLGGIHPTLFPEEMLKNRDIDFVVMGEGEKTLNELVHAVDNNEISKVDGIAYRENEKTVINGSRAMIDNLDELPRPAFAKVDMNFYLQPNLHLIRGIPIKGFYIFTSRGCPYRCRFCVNKNIFGRRIRYRNPSEVVDEIEYLYNRYRIDGFYLYDDTFGVKKSHAVEFCNELIKRRLPLIWGCETRVNLVNEDLLVKLKRAGCVQLDFGIETGSERLLKLLQKDITTDEVRRAIKLCKKYGIRVFSNFMVNLPTETLEDVDTTISFADEIKSDISIFNITCPFPGTDIQTYLKEPISVDDYPLMSSMASYSRYIDFIEAKCKLSAHSISITELLKRIQVFFPTPRDMMLKPNIRYAVNFLRYFNFLINPAYIRSMIKSRSKTDYLRFIVKTLKKQNISTTKL